MTISFRPMVPADRQFVLSGWSSSYRTSPYAGLISYDTWADVMHKELGAIIDAPTTRVLVACEPGEVDHEGREYLYGFLATRSGRWPYVYYVYVKKAFRHPKPYRIASQLFAAADIDPRKPFWFAARTGYGDDILATCTCGRPRRDHGEGWVRMTGDATARLACPGFESKFRGEWDSTPARASRYRNASPETPPREAA